MNTLVLQSSHTHARAHAHAHTQVALAGISDEKVRAQEAYESAGAALRAAAARQRRFKDTQVCTLLLPQRSVNFFSTVC